MKKLLFFTLLLLPSASFSNPFLGKWLASDPADGNIIEFIVEFKNNGVMFMEDLGYFDDEEYYDDEYAGISSVKIQLEVNRYNYNNDFIEIIPGYDEDGQYVFYRDDGEVFRFLVINKDLLLLFWNYGNASYHEFRRVK